MSNSIIILSNRKVNQFHLNYNKSQIIMESGLSSAVRMDLVSSQQCLPITFHIRLVTYTAQCTQWLTNCSLPSDWLWSNRSILKISQQPQDLQNWEEVSTKLSKKRNLSNTGTCSQILRESKKAKSIIWPQQGRLHPMGTGKKESVLRGSHGHSHCLSKEQHITGWGS